MSSVSKITAERNHKVLLELLTKPGNGICADCKARNPRWASHNFGIFICVNCASIHRKMGTHISKVKSVTLDSWTKEQVESMKSMGNLKSNAIYNANETRHPPPPAMADPEYDPELETYIRSKYQYKNFMDKSAFVALKMGTSRSATSVTPSRSASTPVVKQKESMPLPLPTSTSVPPASSAPVRVPTTLPQQRPSIPTAYSSVQSVRQPVPPTQQPRNDVWTDLISLQDVPRTSSFPLQYQVPTTPQTITPTGIGFGVNMTGNAFSQPVQTANSLAMPYQQMPFSQASQPSGFAASNSLAPLAPYSTGFGAPAAQMASQSHQQFLQPQPLLAGPNMIVTQPMVQQAQFATPSPVLLSTPSPALGPYATPSPQMSHPSLPPPGVGFVQSHSTVTITQPAVAGAPQMHMSVPMQPGMPTGFVPSMQPQSPMGYGASVNYQSHTGFGNTAQRQWGGPL